MRKLNHLYFLLSSILCFTFSTTIEAQSIPQNGLKGYWSFNGNANDISANNDNGVATNCTLVQDRFGNPNSAYYFNKQSYITLNDSGFSKFTVAAWLKYENLIDTSVFFSKGNMGISSNEGVILYKTYDSHWLRRANNSGVQELYVPNSVDTSYHHLAITYDELSTKFYEDGVLIASSQNITGPLRQNSLNKYIGGVESSYTSGMDTSRGFHGTIDELGLWHRALDSSEIVTMYNSGFTSTTSLKTAKNDFILYPNPATNTVSINLHQFEPLQKARIIDIKGQVIKEFTIAYKKTDLTLEESISSGLYFLQILDLNDGIIASKKLMIN